MTPASLHTRLTRLERDPRLGRRLWYRWYCDHVLRACDQAARQIALPPDRHRGFLEAVQDAWATLGPHCPASFAYGTAAEQHMSALIWETVDTIMASRFDPATVEKLDVALIAASAALG